MKRFFFLLVIFLAGCASKPVNFQYYHPEITPDPIVLLARVKEIEKENFDNIKLVTLAKNKLSSHHLVIIRNEEPLHYHAKHDGYAMVLRGEGEFLLGDRKFSLKPGSSVFIPRTVHHKAIRRGKEPIAAFVIFTPPYDGKDSIPVNLEAIK